MKRNGFMRTIAIGLAVAIMLSGCTGKDNVSGQMTTENISPTESTEFHFLEEKQASWKDNTLDDMRAVFNLPVKRTQAEGEKAGAGRTGHMVCEGGCVLFKNHLMGYGKDWSGVNGITPEGKGFSCRIEAEEDSTENMVDGMGPVSGKDGYAAFRQLYDEEGGCYFYELDKSFQKTSSVLVNLGMDREISEIMGDAKGNFHITYSASNGKNKYLILSSEGEVVFMTEAKGVLSLRAFGEGRVAVCDVERKSDGPGEKIKRFYEADLDSRELRELVFSQKAADKNGTEGMGLYATPVSDNKVLWCTLIGLYSYDTRDGEVRLLYQWSNHGMLPIAFDCVTTTSDRFVEVLYRDAEGQKYLFLKPTGEREPMSSIIFAVSPDHENRFLSAAAYFNGQYPTYNVTIQTDWDETSLLTQLGTGNGPVIVDTALTGFEDLINLWQPLDGFMEQSGLMQKLLPETMNFGKIGDVTYGIVRDFRIETLVVSNDGPTDWNYKEFLDVAEKFRAAPITHWYGDGIADRRQKYFDLLKNGIGDNYYFDVNTGEMIFGTKEFDRVLRLSERAKKCPPAENGEAIRDGEALCEIVDVYGIQDVISLRKRLEANGERVIGYPTADGARNLLIAGEPIAIRSTATEEEKQIAYTFLKYVLSRESYEAISNGYIPVRMDALEDKFDQYENTLSTLAEGGGAAKYGMPELDREKDLSFLSDLIDNGTVKKSFPKSLQKVFDEELEDYLAGRIDGKALGNHLSSRVWLYLEESR